MTARFTPETDHAAARLALHRIATRSSPDHVAKLLGVSRAALYRYEKGEIVKLSTVHAISGLLGMTFAEVTAPLSQSEIAAAQGHDGLNAKAAAHDVLTWFGLLEGAA
jgi:predicted transcriptional regulator